MFIMNKRASNTSERVFSLSFRFFPAAVPADDLPLICLSWKIMAPFRTIMATMGTKVIRSMPSIEWGSEIQRRNLEKV